ncbi:DUF4124 domain-containing protein [Pseudoxanthomonas koreensis]|uniref:DUF4124 domain-containing protein n=1 Tax=Pseudoxanthomonas koreensis TaxID=266061 RepID=UPI00139081E8|nr:DUF4124 domain-containing protein [Pseudoxanthomonas koreensis]KAF1689745.1 DUF4124 domain-containing protein [Pseudoxanthomonas koreensis]
MRILSRSCLLLLAAGFCASAAATNVYQWKDAKGVTHSADKPPSGQKYDTRRIDQRGQYVETAAPAAPAVDPQCTTARQNLQLLGGTSAVQQDTDGDGKPDKTLNDDERAAQKNLAEAAVKAYCPPGG